MPVHWICQRACQFQNTQPACMPRLCHKVHVVAALEYSGHRPFSHNETIDTQGGNFILGSFCLTLEKATAVGGSVAQISAGEGSLEAMGNFFEACDGGCDQKGRANGDVSVLAETPMQDDGCAAGHGAYAGLGCPKAPCSKTHSPSWHKFWLPGQQHRCPHCPSGQNLHQRSSRSCPWLSTTPVLLKQH